jgi:hypothetical protein
MTNITLHKIRQRDRKIHISKLVGEPGKIGQTAWQNQSDVTKIGSTTVRVNEGLGITIQHRESKHAPPREHHRMQCLWIDRLAPQLCLHYWSGGGACQCC